MFIFGAGILVGLLVGMALEWAVDWPAIFGRRTSSGPSQVDEQSGDAPAKK